MNIDERNFDVTHIGENLLASLLLEEGIRGQFFEIFFNDPHNVPEKLEVFPNQKIEVKRDNKRYQVDPEANVDILLKCDEKYYAMELKLGRSITCSSFNLTKGFLKKKCKISANGKLLDGGLCSILRDHGMERHTIYVDNNPIERNWCLVVRNNDIKKKLIKPNSLFNKLFTSSKVSVISLQDLFVSKKMQERFDREVKLQITREPSFWNRWVVPSK